MAYISSQWRRAMDWSEYTLQLLNEEGRRVDRSIRMFDAVTECLSAEALAPPSREFPAGVTLHSEHGRGKKRVIPAQTVVL